MPHAKTIRSSFLAALPIMAGYVVLGLPCGFLWAKVGFNPLQSFLASVILYSGAGQYMIANMLLAGMTPLSIIASVSLVNSRQMLYGASLSRYCAHDKKRLAFLFAATVTDESFGVNLHRFEEDTDWTVKKSFLVNVFSQSSWIAANVVGTLIGQIFSVPTALASFAMTSIFICLLCTQKMNLGNLAAALTAIVSVIVCKLVGLSGPAILIGGVAGVIGGFLVSTRFPSSGEKTSFEHEKSAIEEASL